MCLDQIEKTDEFLMPMPLHVAADLGPVEDVERRKQRGGAVALVIMGHRPGSPLLERQAGLGSVECLNLALLVERQDNRVGGRRDIKADDVTELLDKLRIIGKLELPHAMRPQAVATPDPVNRTGTDPRFAGHQCGRPMGRLTRRLSRVRVATHVITSGVRGEMRAGRVLSRSRPSTSSCKNH